MRSSQLQGLPKNALEFLRLNAKKINECKHCNRHDGCKKELIGNYGMYNELELFKYYLLDGESASEFIQHEIWDSGPIIWLGLKYENTTIEWPECGLYI